MNSGGNTILFVPNESLVIPSDYRVAYKAQNGLTYILTKNYTTDKIHVWSDKVSGTLWGENQGTLITTIDPLQGYHVSSFAYDSDSSILYIVCAQDYGESVILKYDPSISNPQGIQIATIPTSDKVRSALVHNNILYYMDDLTGTLYVYDFNTGKSWTMSMFNTYPPTVRNTPSSIKIIYNKVVVGMNLYDNNNPDRWLVGVSIYDPLTNTSKEYGVADVTKFTGLTSGNSTFVDVALNESGGYNVGFITTTPLNNEYYSTSWYVFTLENTQQQQPPSISPQPSPKESYYFLDKIFTWGGTSSYQFLEYHSVNNTFGYITARSANVINGVIDNTSYGVAVVSVEYNDSYTPIYGYPINATMILDEKHVMYPLGSILIKMNNIDYILFYGYNLSNHNATIALYNVSSNTLLTFTFPEYGPLINGFTYLEIYNESLLKYWIVLVEYNGTLLNLTYSMSASGLQLQLDRIIDLNNLAAWSSIETYGLVDSCSIPYLNLTIIISIEPNSTGYPQLYMYGFNSTPPYLGTPQLNDTISFTSDWSNLSIHDVLCSYNTILIGLYDNETKTSHIYSINLTTVPLGVAEIYRNTTTTTYKFFETYSYGIFLGASFVNQTTGYVQGLVFSVDPSKSLVREIGQLTSLTSSEEVVLATVLNDTFLVTCGISYASSSNLTLAGTQLSATTPVPVPEPEIHSIVVLATTVTVMSILLYIRRRKRLIG